MNSTKHTSMINNFIPFTFYYFPIHCFIFVAMNVQAENISMEQSKVNCDKLSNVSTKYLDDMAEYVGVPKRSMQLEGGVWSNYNGCSVLFTTPKGVFKCIYSHLLSSDNGKTTYAAGYGNCEKTQ